MRAKDLYSGTIMSLRGRCGSLTTGITNLHELTTPLLITYQSLATTYLVHPVDIASTSVADAVGGTGAQQIEICGLDGNYNIQTEIVNTSGSLTVPATSTKSYLRIFSAQVVRTGSGMINAGAIVVYKSGQGGTLAGGIPPTQTSLWLRMLAGYGTATSGIFTVPKGYTVEARQLIVTARTQISDLYIVSQETGVQEIQTLTITAKPTASGNLSIVLDGTTAVTVAVLDTDSIEQVCTKIASYTYKGWTAVATATTVVFTSNVGILRAGANTLGVAATGVVGAFVETLAGASNPYQTEFAIGTSNNALCIDLPLINDFRWTEKTDIYLRALSTTAAGVVTANLLLRKV